MVLCALLAGGFRDRLPFSSLDVAIAIVVLCDGIGVREDGHDRGTRTIGRAAHLEVFHDGRFGPFGFVKLDDHRGPVLKQLHSYSISGKFSYDLFSSSGLRSLDYKINENNHLVPRPAKSAVLVEPKAGATREFPRFLRRRYRPSLQNGLI